MPAAKTPEQHLQDIRDLIIEEGLQEEWEAKAYARKDGKLHLILMKHLTCGCEKENRKSRDRIFTCANKECIQKKTEKTNMEKFGAKTPLLNKEVQEKIKQTNLEKYGVENVLSLKEYRATPEMAWTDEVRKKRENTFQEKYGVSKVSDIFSVREKIREAHSKDFQPREEWQIEAVSSEENFISYLKTFENRPTQEELMKLLFLSYGAINKYIHKYFAEPFIQWNPRTSRAEKEIADYISGLGFEIITSDRKSLGNNQELDIFVPSLNVAFEFNGLYWHSDIKKDKFYHIEKTRQAANKGIRLFHIFEDEWEFKEDLVKSKIAAVLKIKSESVYARNCKIKDCPSKERNIFLNKHHLQGADKASFSYGLCDNDELVAVISFSKPRIALGQKNEKEGVYELSRFATSKRCVGGFAKLLTHFLKAENPEEVYTYADLRWTSPESNIYLNNNFKEVSISDPNYFYLLNKDGIGPGTEIRVNRFNFTKHKCLELFPNYDETYTEKEIMEAEGYLRIHDCGAIKYSLKRERA